MERRGSNYMLRRDERLLVDADEFEALLRQAARDTERAAIHWTRALALYQGEYLQELPYVEWAEQERERLRRFQQSVRTPLVQPQLQSHSISERQ